MAVDASTMEALELDRLDLPPSIPVESLQVEEYVDTSGDDSLDRRVDLFPFIRMVKASELREIRERA